MPNTRTPILKAILGSVTGIVAGAGNIVIKLPPGATYEDVLLYCTIAGTAATLAQLSTMFLGVRITVSGRERASVTALQLIAIREFYMAGSAGFIKIPIAQFLHTNPVDQTGFDWGTDGESSIEITIATDATNTVDAIVPYASIRPVAQKPGVHVRLSSISPSLVVGTQQTTLPWSNSPSESLLALHIFVPTISKFTAVSVLTDGGVRVIDSGMPWVAIEEFNKSGPVPRLTQSTAFKSRTIDFRRSGLAGDALQLDMSLLQLETTFITTDPGATPIIAEIATTL